MAKKVAMCCERRRCWTREHEFFEIALHRCPAKWLGTYARSQSVAWKLLNIWLQFVGQRAEIWNA
jgi:hypothetical protein